MTVPPILPRLFKISNMKDWLILCLLITGNCLLAQVIPVGFMQKAVPLLVSTSQVTSITSTSASSGGNVTSDGGKSITAKGVVWSTSINPTIALTTKTNQGAGSGVFSSNLTGLAEVNKYYVRAYAQNASATSYGDEISFWTSGPNGVTIGTKIWSNRNLEVTTYRNGDPITFASNATEWNAAKNAGIGAWTYYNWDAANGTIFGKLYNWYAVNDSRGLAPTGWHIPTKAEYTTLASNTSSSLKSTSSEWGANYGTNSTGFTGLPGGALNASVSFEAKGTSGWFWTSEADPTNSLNAYWRILHGTAGFLDVGSYSKTIGMSVRLVKD